MSRSRFLSALAAATLGVTMLGACSAESLTERAVETGLEQALEADGDIDLDFDDNGSGGFSITTEEGEFSINVDGEAGSIVFDTEDGEGSINFDEEAGTVDVSTDDGSASIATNVAAPDGWPSVIGVPATSPPDSTSYNVVEIEGVTFGISADFAHAADEPFGERVVAALKADGWTGDTVTTNDGGVGGTLQKDGARMQITSDPQFTSLLLTLPRS